MIDLTPKTRKYWIYTVEGAEFSTNDNEPFGEAWKEALAYAKANHFPIWRLEVKENLGGEVLHEEWQFWANGCFLAERFYSPERIYIPM